MKKFYSNINWNVISKNILKFNSNSHIFIYFHKNDHVKIRKLIQFIKYKLSKFSKFSKFSKLYNCFFFIKDK